MQLSTLQKLLDFDGVMTQFNLNFFLKFQNLDGGTPPTLPDHDVPGSYPIFTSNGTKISVSLESLRGPLYASKSWGPLGAVLTPKLTIVLDKNVC